MYTRLYTNVLNHYHWMYSCTAQNHAYADTGFFTITASGPPRQVRRSMVIFWTIRSGSALLHLYLFLLSGWTDCFPRHRRVYQARFGWLRRDGVQARKEATSGRSFDNRYRDNLHICSGISTRKMRIFRSKCKYSIFDSQCS